MFLSSSYSGTWEREILHQRDLVLRHIYRVYLGMHRTLYLVFVHEQVLLC